MYTYIISKRNEISLTTHPLVLAYYELIYYIKLWFLFSSPCQTWWWPYNKRAETCRLSSDSLYLNKVLLCFDLPTLRIEIICVEVSSLLEREVMWLNTAQRRSTVPFKDCLTLKMKVLRYFGNLGIYSPKETVSHPRRLKTFVKNALLTWDIANVFVI